MKTWGFINLGTVYANEIRGANGLQQIVVYHVLDAFSVNYKIFSFGKIL